MTGDVWGKGRRKRQENARWHTLENAGLKADVSIWTVTGAFLSSLGTHLTVPLKCAGHGFTVSKCAPSADLTWLLFLPLGSG